MNRTIVTGLIFLALCFFCEAKAQSLSTKIIRIEVDGKPIRKSFKVLFLSNENWIGAEKKTTGFVVPEQLKKEEYLTVLIVFGKNKLIFSKIHISKFDENWVVGIDKKPFSKEIDYLIEKKTVKRVYYINFVGNALETRFLVEEKIKN